MEHAGVDKPTVGVVVPTGYSFNLDGTAIYLTMASLFIAEAMGDPLCIGEQISLLLFMMIASKGAAGVTGAGMATLAGGLSSHRPELVDGVGLIVGIDRFMSEARALTNFAGNAVATVLIGTGPAASTAPRLDRVLAGDDPFDETTMLDDRTRRCRSPWSRTSRSISGTPSPSDLAPGPAEVQDPFVAPAQAGATNAFLPVRRSWRRQPTWAGGSARRLGPPATWRRL